MRFICDKTLNDTVVVGVNGVQTLPYSTEKRGNREHVRLLKSFPSVTLHTDC